MKRRLLVFLALSASALAAESPSPEFRVELFSHQTIKAVTLQATEHSVEICGSKADGPCLVLPPAGKVSCFAARLVHCRSEAGGRDFTLLTIDSPLRVAPTFAGASGPPQTILLRNARLRSTGTGLQVVTRVDLESYVSGVVRGEASVLHTPAARQAMAILARTWALRWQGRHSAGGYDFCSLTHCQVFRLPPEGETHEADGLEAATFATRGEVLKYHGELADPYFTACCGGVTEAAGNVWPDRAQPYLVSVHDPYCLANQHASWTQTLASDRLEQVLREALRLPMAAPLAELAVEKYDASGRALVLRIVAGAVWNVDANQFRYAVDRRLGWEQIKSNLYIVERRGDSWTFSGHGLGHGVGLCQAGAEQMARLGFSPERILSAYFPGTEIGTPGDADPVASSEHFELIYPDSQGPWVRQSLDALEHWRRELGPHAAVLPPRVRVTTWASTAGFIRATDEPGWMAATSDGQSIALQPLQLLARKQILYQTLRHELTHLVVHRLCAKGVPRWLEEGWVLYLTGERIEGRPDSFRTTRELEDAITNPRSEAGMKAAYAQALDRVRRLVQREGDTAVWQMLEQPSALELRELQEGK
jgi:stage II sporulation protein D